MARQNMTLTKRPIASYEHKNKQRVNNPPVGLVTQNTDPDAGAKKTYAYDPHLDPQLQWAGKAEHTSFAVPTVSLHVHERIDPRTIIEAVKRPNGGARARQLGLFETERAAPLRQAVEFYQHAHGWSNRMVAGDSLLVMNSLLEKEGLAGKVQMVYLDPPYGIRYGSNFQPFVNKRDVKDGKDEDLTAEPEQIRAFRDTWELGIHSYLSYLRDRLLLARELLTESGSIFVQISDENVHHVRELMDEVFGLANFAGLIFVAKTSGYGETISLSSVGDYLVWYAKDKPRLKYRQLFLDKSPDSSYARDYKWLESANGETRRNATKAELEDRGAVDRSWRWFSLTATTSQGSTARGSFSVKVGEKAFEISGDQHWKTSREGMERLIWARRIHARENSLRYVRYLNDFPVVPISNNWMDLRWGYDAGDKRYVVETNPQIVARCLLMTTDPGDLVFDPTCGSGTTAFVAEQWGRRWITCDTSRVALTLAKQRLMTAVFDYYKLAYPDEGVDSGFKYKTVPHVTLKSIANNPDIKDGMTREQIDAAIARHAPQETLYDQPLVDKKKTRVSGPFTVEAVPAPAVKSVEELLDGAPQPADSSVTRSGETLRQAEWRDELLRAGIRGKAGQHIRFARLEPLPGCRHLYADGETRPSDEGADQVRETGTAHIPQRIVVAFGPEHAPLEQRQVAHAIDEAQTLVPKPMIIVFAAFQFDPEAAKDIDGTNWPGVTLLKAQMNADLLTDDLKKKRASNESFWLIGQPDVQIERIAQGDDQGKLRVSVHGFDYYNTKTGGVESGGEDRIAVWLLDTDYDGRSLYPRQVFFPMADAKEGWARLAKNLKAEIDEELIEAYRGTVSLPFEAGEHGRIAVKIVDDRGIESLKVMEIEV
ncbi:MAG: site-specific DNA-methyltransferase [Nitrococcus sp.]|nr:site-specific DNA-methyltransferase [Nitrococcus sp.]